MNDFHDLADLPGTPQEQAWLKERLETLSVREGIILAAAAMKDPPEDMVQAINQLQSLNHYEVRFNAGSYKALGMAYLQNETRMPENALPFVDLEQMGRHYEDKHPGLFIGDCYVEYPRNAPQPVYQGQGSPLPEDDDWSVRLKIASAAVPEGVWLCLPSPSNWDDESLQDEMLALQALRVRHLDDCTLLDAQCILPEAGNLMEQYVSVGDLIYDGQELGYVLGEHGQGSPTFMARYAAALEYEDCRTLRFALDISQSLFCYEWISSSELADFAAEQLRSSGVSEELIPLIDLERYADDILTGCGYILTRDESAYVARNNREFTYEHSVPDEAGMTMQ